MDAAAALIAENAAFAELFRTADPDIPVPSCPEWSLRQLMLHVGRGDRWCAQIVAEQSMDYVDPRTVPGGAAPADRDGQIGWLHDGAAALLDAVAGTGADTEVWTFLGPRPARWWIRRRLHETLVHRADAALALGIPFETAPDLAADAVTEYLERVVIRAADAPPLRDGQSLHLHATDPGLGPAGEWTVLGRADGIAVASEHGQADVALRGPARDVELRGPARDLLLAVVRRGEATALGLEMFGDAGVWDGWLARTPF